MKIKPLLKHIPAILVYLLGSTIYLVCRWLTRIFGVGLDEIIFTITSPLNGADMGTALSAVKHCAPGMALTLLLTVAAAHFLEKLPAAPVALPLKKRSLSLKPLPLARGLFWTLSVVVLGLGVLHAQNTYDFVGYIYNRTHPTQIYETYYVDPKDANIRLETQDAQPKNLIYIYLESLETTYTSTENGGAQDTCYIPNLVQLAQENVSFSNTDKLGGFHCVDGTGYTMGALLSTTSGVPLAFPVKANTQMFRYQFASGLTTLGDILKDFGYQQMFLCGSDAKFACRDTYFSQHGDYELFDLFTAREEGYIPEDYYVWWGYEDMYLYQIAKDQILELAQQDAPFNFTMLTVDAHHIGGYVCSLCEDTYDMPVKNVISCGDRQLGEFIDWCRQQSFFEDTVIIITGDHPRMDTQIVGHVDYDARTIYNCFINAVPTGPLQTTNRTFTSMDIFPTTLAALGFTWDGDRLGMGTNLFSGTQTLAELLGYEYIKNEFSKTSPYFVDRFL